PAAQHHRADVRLVEGEPQGRHSLRQAGKKFCCNGHPGLHAAVPTAVLFVQNLGIYAAPPRVVTVASSLTMRHVRLRRLAAPATRLDCPTLQVSISDS